MIKIKQSGDFEKTTKYFARVKKLARKIDLDKYGQLGVEALMSATPTDTGETATQWGYYITRDRHTASIVFTNDNIQNGVNIAIILQYGHATRNGGYVQGRDYINPAIQPIFESIANEAWREMKKQ